jgi:DNA polymerase elongation subunit (family B)
MEAYTRKQIDYEKDSIRFQALEWVDSNEEVEDSVDDSEEVYNKYVIRAFGVTREGDSVCLTIHDFKPFFYVKVPESWNNIDVSKFLLNLKSVTGYYNGRPYKSLYKWGKYLVSKDSIIQKKKDFYGFSGEKEFKFLKLVFNNSEAARRFNYTIKAHNDPEDKVRIENSPKELKLYESNVDPILKFFHERDIAPTGWIVATDTISIFDDRNTRCQIELEADISNVSSDYSDETNARILQASFDIEVYSIDGSFPLPKINGNCVTQIATAFKYFGDSDFLVKHIICLKECAPISEPGVIMEWYLTEKEVLLAWRRLINQMDPDILYTYNGDQFDCNYLFERSKISHCEEEFLDISKMIWNHSILKVKTFNSSAYGNSEYNRLSIPGRLNFDILIYIQREYKENSYSLNSISQKFLEGDKKNDMTPNQMFDFFASGDPEKIKMLAEYCIKDTLLPQLLVDKMCILQNQISMSNVTSVPFKFLVERGQSIKAFSQILKETRKMNYIIPVLKYGSSEDSEGFEGATVLTPQTGAYFTPITVCDFASLYPSIMQAHNLCFSTIVLDEQYSDLPGVEYKTMEWFDAKTKTTKSVKFVINTKGVLPKLLKTLTASRKKYKALMKAAIDPFEKEIYNKCQLAVKVSMNSMYGFLASPIMCCKPIAATVTAYGRKMIADTKSYLESNYPCSVAVYGDSVTGKTPLLLERNGMVHIETIKDLFDKNNKIDYPGFKILDESIRTEKEYSHCNYKIWTESGWQKIKKVIRHRCDKKIYRVATDTGYVEVTEDHSLLDENAVIIKPKDCVIGTKLLSSYPDKFNENTTGLSNSRSKIYGFFFGCGDLDFDNKKIWWVVHPDLDLLKIFKQEISEEYPGSIQIIWDTVKFPGGYKMSVSFNDKNIANEFRYKFYNSDKNKKVPTEILNSDNENINKFIIGYSSASKKNISNMSYSNSQIGSAGIYYLFKKLGYNTSIITDSDQKDDIIIVSYGYIVREETNKIKKLESFDHSDYVYDVETESGRFQAGVGDIIVKNTDSVFVNFKTKTTDLYNKEKDRISKHTVITEKSKIYLEGLKSTCIKESMELGKIAAKAITKDLFTAPISLEYEKVYHPLLLLSKKRYIGSYYSDNHLKRDYLDNKGVVLTRRDANKLLKVSYQHIIDIFIEKGQEGLDEVLKYLNNIIDDIKNNRIDKQLLVITKTLKGPYKNGNIPHVVLSKILAERDPGNAPRSNDRIPYLFIDNGFLKNTTPQYMKVEDPVYAIKNNLPVDTAYYIKALSTPLCEILELFMKNPEIIFKDVVKEYNKNRLAKLKTKLKTI